MCQFLFVQQLTHCKNQSEQKQKQKKQRGSIVKNEDPVCF